MGPENRLIVRTVCGLEDSLSKARFGAVHKLMQWLPSPLHGGQAVTSDAATGAGAGAVGLIALLPPATMASRVLGSVCLLGDTTAKVS